MFTFREKLFSAKKKKISVGFLVHFFQLKETCRVSQKGFAKFFLLNVSVI